MAQNAVNEVDEMIKQLKSKPGFHAYILMNNDGIVIKYENMEYREAVMHSYHILDLYSKSKQHMSKLMDPTENEVESIRLRTKLHEMIVAQFSRFTLVVLQLPCSEDKAEEVPAIGKEKEAEEKIAG